MGNVSVTSPLLLVGWTMRARYARAGPLSCAAVTPAVSSSRHRPEFDRELTPAQRVHAEAVERRAVLGAEAFPGGGGEQQRTAELARERLDPRGDVRRVTDRGVLQATTAADGAGHDRAGRLPGADPVRP